MRFGGRRCILCTCYGTQPIDAPAIGTALEAQGRPILVDRLCRDDLDVFEKTLESGEHLLVACEQEAALFQEIAGEAQIDFTDIRDAAGWSGEGDRAAAKMAALLAAATVELPPAPAVELTSRGRCVVYGEGQAALDVGVRLATRLDVTVVLSGSPEEIVLPRLREMAVLFGRLGRARGHLGAFELDLSRARRVLPWSRDEVELEPAPSKLEVDLVFDLSGGTPLFVAPEKRDGYRRADPARPAAVERAIIEIVDLVGTFEKPRYVSFQADLCAHSRSRKIGCARCINHCPTGAITPDGDHVAIDPMICAGCGSCAGLCPTGAATYDAPEPTALSRRMRELLVIYAKAGGERPVLLVHEAAHGKDLISALARYGDGLPANVLPLGVTNLGQLGLDFLLAALAFGAERVVLLASPANAGDLIAVDTNVGYADAVASGLGYGAGRVQLVSEDDPDRLLQWLVEPLPDAETSRARFMPVGGKRDRMRLALDALHDSAPEPVDVVALPFEAPFGNVNVDVDGCTLCLSCVGACPTGALIDNPDKPTLRFLEDACVQCGLCRSICPEKVITLEPRVSFLPEAKSPRTIKEEEPFECVRCGKPFGTRSSVMRIVTQLAGKHSMFQDSDAAARLQMCDDCRIKVQFEAKDNPMTAGARPAVRTTDDYLKERQEIAEARRRFRDGE